MSSIVEFGTKWCFKEGTSLRGNTSFELPVEVSERVTGLLGCEELQLCHLSYFDMQRADFNEILHADRC